MVLKLLSSGRWRDLETGRFVRAPTEISRGKWVNAKGAPVEVKLPSYMIVTREYRAAQAAPRKTATKAVKTSSPKIMTGEQFISEYGLPPVEYPTTEAMKFKKGVINMGVMHETSRQNQMKIRKMDADKLLLLYKEEPTLFDMYFEYEQDAFGMSGYYHEDNGGDIVELLIEEYESRYGRIK